VSLVGIKLDSRSALTGLSVLAKVMEIHATDDGTQVPVLHFMKSKIQICSIHQKNRQISKVIPSTPPQWEKTITALNCCL